MNKLDLVVADEIIPPVEDLLEQFFETGKILIKSSSNGIIDAIEALRLKRHEQNFKKLLAYIDDAQKLKDFISRSNKKQKEFLVQVLIKTANLENDIQIFIMSRIMQNLKNNGEPSYYESSLFTNINSLTLEDFEVFYEIWLHKTTNEKGYYYFQTPVEKEFYVDIQNKLFSIGIIEKPVSTNNFSTGEKPERKMCTFGGTGFSEYLFQILKEYFEANK
ncbi:MAG: hypothetical protein PHE67_10950 [Campylobacterales bacterium]|nr:hypothetical protein [Campylobacterales bacterium]